MLMLFSRICLFRFLKLKILSNPNNINSTVDILMRRFPPNTLKSCAVRLRNKAPNTAKNIQIVCILCNIFFDWFRFEWEQIVCKNKIIFA